LRAFTDRTSTGPEWLRRELARAIARGFALEDREFEPNTRGLAAPVFAEGDDAVAALGVVAPADRLPLDRQQGVVKAILQSAKRLSADLRAENP
jgi:DNA-binding IclR family transcriptional regulator